LDGDGLDENRGRGKSQEQDESSGYFAACPRPEVIG